MPTLTLIFRGKPLAFTLEKIDRDALYGYYEMLTLDVDGAVCESALLTGDGHTLAGKGDTAIAYLSPDGDWRERSELHAVAPDGAEIIPVKPTFAFPVDLAGKETTLDDFLAHSVRLVYHLIPAGDASPAELLAELEEGVIYRFPFSYRGGDLADPAYLLAGDAGGLFLCVGQPLALEYAALDTPGAIAQEEETEEEDAELDFSAL